MIVVVATAGPAQARPRFQTDTDAWVLLSVEPAHTSPEESPDSCYNSFEVTVGDLTATTSAKCTWPSPPVDVWNRTQHSWSAAPPVRFVPGETWQITSTVSTEGTYQSNGLSGGGSSWVDIYLSPGGGPYAGTQWAGVVEGQPSSSAVSEFSMPSGSNGTLMTVNLNFQGPGGSGTIIYTYGWNGSIESTASTSTTSAASTTTASVALPAPPIHDEPCPSEPEDSGARFSSIAKEVEVFPESDQNAIFPAKPNTILYVCDHVMTGEESEAVITFADLSTIRVRPETEIVIASPRLHSTHVDVRKGTLWMKFWKVVLGDAIEVKSNLAVTGIKGTTIVLEVTEGSDVLKVIEGHVEFTSLSTGKTTIVDGGQTATATPQGISEATSFDVAAESKLWGQEPPPSATGTRSRSGPVTAGLVGVVVLAAAAGGWLLVDRGRKGRSPAAKAQSAVASTATSAVPAGWLADPAGVHEYRYWDGSAWSPNVSDAGAVTTDPLDAYS